MLETSINANKARAYWVLTPTYGIFTPPCNTCGIDATHEWKGVHLCTDCFWEKKAKLLEDRNNAT